MKVFSVELNNPPNGVFFPGMHVTGAVVCATDEPKSYMQIVISLVGRAHAFWTESDGAGADSSSRHYNSSEEYLNYSGVLWDKTVNGQGGDFPAGNYRFQFSIPLVGTNGASLPASYSGGSGSVSYVLEARVVKGSLQFDHKAKVTLNVATVIKIDHPDLAPPLSMETRKTIGFLCCESGPVGLSARIPRTGFCIGHDTIPVEIKVENGSNKDLRDIQVSLRKHVIYTAQGHHHYDHHDVQVVHTRPVLPGETAVIQSDPIPIPASIPPTLRNCSILTVNYYVVVTGLATYLFNPCLELPVVIGNVPLERSSQPQMNFPPIQAATPFMAEPTSDLYPPPPVGVNPIPLPTKDMPLPEPLPTKDISLSDPPPIGFVDPVKKL